MSFSDLKQQFRREPFTVIEIDLPYCELTHSESPCTATGTGDDRCFNTRASCQDVPNFTPETKTYRFCTHSSPFPFGLDAIPSLAGEPSMAPAQIDIEGGIGVRSNVSIQFNDHPSSDIDIDKYLDGRSYIASERGSYWTKFRARNPFYIGAPLRVLTGYLVNGEYDESNFQVRHYVIEKLNVSGGRASITAKDPLKLADDKRAQAPAPSRGELQDPISDTQTSITISPSGEYSSGDYIRIRSEVMEITDISGDVFTVNRGQYNTIATEHDEGDTAQLCLEYVGERVDDIVSDLLTTYAGVDSSFIPSSSWADEVDIWLPGLLSTLITEPVGVSKLLKELGEQAPHSLYWDDRTQRIEFTAVQPPPIDARPLSDFESFLEDSIVIEDKPDMRINTVQVYFGQFDPTQKLDEIRNYRQQYVRLDIDSLTLYGSNKIKTIFSRWISNLNKAAAVTLAQRIGRRFADIPRSISFALDPKDSSVWAGQTIRADTFDITDFTGAPEMTPFQIISVRPSESSYRYSAIEYTYGAELPEDQEEGEQVIRIGGDVNNLNIRAAFDTLFPAPDENTVVRLVVESGATVGSNSTASPALETGSWPSGMDPVKIDVRGRVLGHGGNGGGGADINGTDGGDAISLQFDAELINLGIIGSGGGGGAAVIASDSTGSYLSSGGGGAGRNVGQGGETDGTYDQFSNGSNGSAESGGSPGFPIVWETEELTTGTIQGGAGGDLGAAGSVGSASGTLNDSQGTPGQPGTAIVTNGNTLIETESGDIRGAII